MKKTLIGLLAVGSISAFAANSFTIVNKTNPGQDISLKCLTDQCKSLDLEYRENEQVVSKSTIHIEEVAGDASEELERIGVPYEEGTFDMFPYELTNDYETRLFHSVTPRDKFVNGSMLVLSAIADTLLLPAETVAYYNLTRLEGKDNRKAARKTKRILKGSKDKKIGDKKFQIIKKYLDL